MLPFAIDRDQRAQSLRTHALIDLVWGMWLGAVVDEIDELTPLGNSKPVSAFRWHRYMTKSSKYIGAKYVVVLGAWHSSHIAAQLLMGIRELDEAEQ